MTNPTSDLQLNDVLMSCPHCNGSGTVPAIKRVWYKPPVGRRCEALVLGTASRKGRVRITVYIKGMGQVERTVLPTSLEPRP